MICKGKESEKENMYLQVYEASSMAQWVKSLPATQETQEMQVWSLSQEDPLEKEMATHSSILVWKTPWTEEPGGLQSEEPQRGQTQLND